MQLTVHNYDKNRKKLEYVQTPTKPRFAPSYIISGQRADEFVKKYNEQSDSLVKNSILMTVSGAIAGCGMALSQNAKKVGLVIKSGVGAIIGLIVGITISQHEKNKLMDEYHVEEI